MRRALAAALALLLGGCVLTSRAPLITKADFAPGLTDGLYQPYVTVAPDDVRKIARKVRSRCLSPGYGFRPLRADGKPGGWVQPIYCPYDPDEKRIVPPVRIVRAGAGYQVDGFGHVELQRLGANIWLWQGYAPARSEGHATHTEPVFEYWLVRPFAFGLDFTMLGCDNFPSLDRTELVTVDEPGPLLARTPAGKHSSTSVAVAGRATSHKCEASALEPLRPELNKVVARAEVGEEPVVLLLRRVPEADVKPR